MFLDAIRLFTKSSQFRCHKIVWPMIVSGRKNFDFKSIDVSNRGVKDFKASPKLNVGPEVNDK